ncbi:unnamed protein product, partial [Phaeothamnion confervicola]
FEFQQRLISIFPQAADLQYQVAIALKERGDFGGALQELQRILTGRPDDIVALGHRAECLVAIQRMDEASTTYARIVQLDPSQVDVRRALIAALLQLNKPEEASQQLSALAADDPKR